MENYLLYTDASTLWALYTRKGFSFALEYARENGWTQEELEILIEQASAEGWN